MALFDDVGEGWTLTEAYENFREFEAEDETDIDSLTLYRTEPRWVVPGNLTLRWGLLVVNLLDETADFVFRKREWRPRRTSRNYEWRWEEPYSPCSSSLDCCKYVGPAPAQIGKV